MPHLFIAVTAHGYGHLAQVAPVAAALARRLPGLRITLQGTLDPGYAASRMPDGCRHIHAAVDVVLPMDGPLTVRWEAGLAQYRAFEADYGTHLAAQMRRFEADPPSLVLASIPWLPLDAARRLGIPAVGLCSLTWLDILRGSPVGEHLPVAMAERMRRAYGEAELFLRPAPSMPMRWLPNGRDIGPIAAPRRRDPVGLRRRLGIVPDRRLVLAMFGGAGRLPIGGPLPDALCLLTPDAEAAAGRPDVIAIGTGAGGDTPGVAEVLASCDAVITKPGYGTFAEAACCGVPVLYVPRPDWPETPPLLEWLVQRVPTRAISPEALAAGAIAEPLAEVLGAGPVAATEPTGVAEAVELLEGMLGR
jgi:hypothetical protein